MKFLGYFPESLFPCRNEFDLEVFQNRIIKGETEASKSFVTICGLARNIESVLPYTIARIETIGSLFRDYSVILYENDSSDNTKSLLLEWQKKNNHVRIISETIGTKFHGSVKSLTRRQDMAFYRNKYLDVCRSIKSDYTIILDTDVIGGYSYFGLLSSLGFEQEWSSITSNSILFRKLEDGNVERLFFDTWPLRLFGSHEEVCGPKGNALRWERGDEFEELYSGFGGLSIYRSNDLNNCTYDSYDVDHKTICDQLRKNDGRVWINASQIVLYSHSEITRKLTELK